MAVAAFSAASSTAAGAGLQPPALTGRVARGPHDRSTTRPGHAGPGRRLLAPALERPRLTGPRRRHPRPRRAHRGPAAAAARGLHVIGIDRDPRGAARWPGAPGAVRATGSTSSHAVYDEIGEVARPRRGAGSHASRACCSTSASRACSWTCASAGSPTPRTLRSTCGWTTPPASPPRTSSTPTPAASWPGCFAVRRGAVRRADRLPRRRGPASRSRSPPRPGWSS